MRSERIVMQTLIAFAQAHEDICGAYLNGSRANPRAPKDWLRDYDCVFVVDSLQPYLDSNIWQKALGKVAFIQEPDLELKDTGINSYGWLMLFDDHVRIDLTIETLACYHSKKKDSMLVSIYDPKGLLKDNPETSDRDYWLARPTSETYYATVNDFWWCLNNCAKGLIRQEQPYAYYMFYNICCECLNRVIEWDIAYVNDYQINPGKHGKWFKRHMSVDEYAQYLQIYNLPLWEAIDAAMDLMSGVASRVSHGLGVKYRGYEEEAMREHIKWMKQFQHPKGEHI